MQPFQINHRIAIKALVIALLGICVYGQALAQDLGTGNVGQDAARATEVPRFINPNTVEPSVTTTTIRSIRFLTTDDFPPFNFVSPKGRLEGFNVGLARALCFEIKARCSMLALPWDKLTEALESGQGDAIIAGLAISSESLRQFAFSRSYLKLPARFFTTTEKAGRLDPFDISQARNVGVQTGTAHDAFLAEHFPQASITRYGDQNALRDAVSEGAVDVGFGDAISTSFWLQSADADACCAFVGGPYLNADFFGEGLAIAVPQDRLDLKTALDNGLTRLMRNGKSVEVYLRYFPVDIF